MFEVTGLQVPAVRQQCGVTAPRRTAGRCVQPHDSEGRACGGSTRSEIGFEACRQGLYARPRLRVPLVRYERTGDASLTAATGAETVCADLLQRRPDADSR